MGAGQAAVFLEEFSEDETMIKNVASLIRWHMQMLFVVRSMQFADIKGMLQDTDVDEIALLGYCDRMGRLNADRKAENENLQIFLEKCHEFTT